MRVIRLRIWRCSALVSIGAVLAISSAVAKQSSGTESAGLVEANVGPAVAYHVKDSSRWNLGVGWKPKASLTLRLGARNLLNQDPPFTAVSSYGSHVTGYAGSFVDPRGRFWYVSANYQFK